MTSAFKSLLLATCISLNYSNILAQDNTSPSFDVATIKPHPPGPLSVSGLMNTPDGANGTAITLATLVQHAYGLRSPDQVIGTPDWAKTEWFDLQAKMSDADTAAMQKMRPAESSALRQRLLQTLLADRFHLKAHPATKQAPVYDLVIAKGGPKLKDAATDPSTVKGPDGKPLGFLRFFKDSSVAHAYSIGDLANFLSQPMAGVGRPVVDKTGLTGTYNFTLDWTPPVKTVLPEAVASPDDTTSVFTALEDLGLKLQPSTGPIDTVVVDHVDHPTPD